MAHAASTGWRLSTASTTPEGQAILGVATQLAASIGILGPLAIRITNRVPTTKHLMEYQACEVWGWRIGHPEVLIQMWLDTAGDRATSSGAERPSLPLRLWATRATTEES
eukprot:4343626-Amphidinium_carterae.1